MLDLKHWYNIEVPILTRANSDSCVAVAKDFEWRRAGHDLGQQAGVRYRISSYTKSQEDELRIETKRETEIFSIKLCGLMSILKRPEGSDPRNHRACWQPTATPAETLVGSILVHATARQALQLLKSHSNS